MLGVPRRLRRFASGHDVAFGVRRFRRNTASHRKAAEAARGGNYSNDAVCAFTGICYALLLHRQGRSQPQAKTHEEGSGPALQRSSAPAGTLQSCPSSVKPPSHTRAAVSTPKDCALTLRSSRRVPAARFRPSFHSEPYAFCLHARLNSNVRPLKNLCSRIAMAALDRTRNDWQANCSWQPCLPFAVAAKLV